MRAYPRPATRVSWSRRTTTVAFASGARVCSHPKEWRAIAASASAWICGIDRGSSTTAPEPEPDVAGSRRRRVSLTIASIAVLMGAAVSGSRRACRCTMPAASSRIVSERSLRSCSSRGSTPSRSSRASASRTPRTSRSSGTRSARSTRTASVVSASAGSARRRTRSSIAVITDAASTPMPPVSSAAATCGCRDGSRSPPNVCRPAVAVPTAISFAASPRGCPGRCGDHPHGVVEPVRPGEAGLAQLGAGPFRHLGRDAGEERLGVASHPRERVSDPDQTRIAHLLDLDLRGALERPERRHRPGPRRTQRRDVAFEGVQGLFHGSILHRPTAQKTALIRHIPCGQLRNQPACGGQVGDGEEGAQGIGLRFHAGRSTRSLDQHSGHQSRIADVHRRSTPYAAKCGSAVRTVSRSAIA